MSIISTIFHVPIILVCTMLPDHAFWFNFFHPARIIYSILWAYLYPLPVVSSISPRIHVSMKLIWLMVHYNYFLFTFFPPTHNIPIIILASVYTLPFLISISLSIRVSMRLVWIMVPSNYFRLAVFPPTNIIPVFWMWLILPIVDCRSQRCTLDKNGYRNQIWSQYPFNLRNILSPWI